MSYSGCLCLNCGKVDHSHVPGFATGGHTHEFLKPDSPRTYLQGVASMNDSSPSTHTSTELPQGLPSPPRSLSSHAKPCPPAPSLSHNHEPQGDPQPLSSFVSKATLSLGGPGWQMVIDGMCRHVSGRARVRCLEGRTVTLRAPWNRSLA